MNPVIQALKELGGSGTVEEINRKDAVKEATRDGASAIDLIDGDQLLDKLKELGLGVKTEKIEVEKVTVNHTWLLSI
jgi:restriction system protein